MKDIIYDDKMVKGSYELRVGDKVSTIPYFYNCILATNGTIVNIIERPDEDSDEYIVKFPDRADHYTFKEIELLRELDYSEYFTPAEGGFCNIRLGVFDFEEPEDCSVPHFHFIRVDDINKPIPRDAIYTGGAICFNSLDYYDHGSYNDRLTEYELEELKKYLKTQLDPDCNIWEYLIYNWNANYPDEEYKQVEEYIEMPDYKYDDMGVIKR